MDSAGGVSAYQLVFGSNPVDLSGWEGNDEDSLFTQDTSLAGQSAQQWICGCARTHPDDMDDMRL